MAILLRNLQDGDFFAVLAKPLKLDGTVLQSEQCVVLALAHVGTGMDFGAALTDQDIASQYELTVAPLDTQTLGFRITTVTGGANALFMGKILDGNQHRLLHLRYHKVEGVADVSATRMRPIVWGVVDHLEVRGKRLMKFGEVDHHSRH